MRPYDIQEIEMLRIARARAEELRSDWLVVNGSRHRRDNAEPRPKAALLRGAREAAGRRLIAVGRRVLPVEVEPCG